MPKVSDNTMRELEDILNESETYADRLTAFLKLKTAPKPQKNNPFELGDLDISFDFDVDLVKLPSKPQPAAAAAPTKAASAAKEQPLQEITNNGIPPAAAEHIAQPEAPLVSPTQENTRPTPPAALTSPRRSSRSRSSFNVPGSDRLRRVAIQRRSRSLGRRDLLREFNNVTSTSSDFRQQLLSSTPVSEVKATVASEPKQPPGTASPAVAIATQSPPPSDHISSVSQRSLTPDGSAKRRTYTIEMGPEPGQLLLSPSHKSGQRQLQLSPANSTYNVALRQSRLRLSQAREQAELSAARLQILAPETSARTTAQTQPEPEYIVPETQPQPVLHSLGNNTLVAPFMVVPMACLSPQPAKVAQMNAAARVEPVAPVPSVASRSIQTSCNPQDLSEIMTDDESADEQQASGVPLNLAPTGGHTSSRRQLRPRVQNVDSSMQLLDLHRSRSRDARNRSNRKPRQTVLNKPSKAPINGEQFAQELARMSNYEILDLRKRNSLGKLHPLNGNRKPSTEQQRVLEQHLNWEILRRNLDEQPAVQASPLARTPPRSVSMATTEPASKNESLTAATFVHSPAAPPMDFRDSSVLGRHLDSSNQLQRKSRISRRETLTQTPAAPPDAFSDSAAYVRQPRRSRRSRHREPPMSEEDELLTVCTPPSQFRLSRSQTRSRSRRGQHQQQLPESTLAVPPLEYIDVLETSAEEELQLPPPAQFNNNSTAEVADEQASTIRAGQESMQLNSSRRQSKAEKQRQKQEQKEQQDKEKQHQKEKVDKERRKQKKQQEEELQKEMLLQEQNQKEQQQEEEKRRLLKEKQQEEELQKEKLLREQEQKEQQQKEQKQKEQQEQQEREQEQTDTYQQEQLQQHQDEFTQEQQQPEQEEPMPPPPPPEDVFKKPTAPAPRAKRNPKSNLEKQLAKLRINLANETLTPDENQAPEDSNNGVRRSRRGQVQLCNTWVHTVSDPFKFMRKTIDPPKKPAASKSKKREAAAAGGTISHRPPLSSSTPRIPTEPSSSGTISKRKRDQQHEEQQHCHESSGLDALSGISRLSSIAEQDIPEQTVEETPAPPTEPKKRGHKKKTAESKTNSKKNTPSNVAATEMELAESPMPAPDLPASNQSHPQSETLMAWLCGASEVPPETHDVSEIQTDSMFVSRAANLHFSNIEGIEYAFYNSEDRYSMGYMRFQPLQARGFKRAKTNTLRFVALVGQFEFEIISQNSTESYQDILYTGDTLQIKKGSRYNVKNRLDNVSVLMVLRSECA